MKQNIFLILITILMLTSCNFFINKDVKNMDSEKAIDLINMDTEYKPGEDFFLYANGGWLADNPIPDEYSRYGAFEVLDKKSKYQIKEIILATLEKENSKKSTPEQQIRDFYISAMDSLKIDELSYKPIKPILDEIDEISTKEELFKMMVDLNEIGVNVGFHLFASIDDKNSNRYIPNLMQGGLGLPDRDYYTSKDSRSQEIRDKYVKHISEMLKMIKVDDSKEVANDIMDFETRLAKSSLTRLEMREPSATYHLMDYDLISKNYKYFDYVEYLKSSGIENISEANIMQPEFFKEFNLRYNYSPISVWKNYLKWHTLNSNASLLSSEIEKMHFDFFKTELSGITKMQDRWKRVIASINSSLGEAVGKLYVEKHFPPEAKQKMENLVANLRLSLEESIKNLDWMNDSTKIKALAKLGTMNLKVGYPNKWKDYSSIDIKPDTYIENVWNARKYQKNFNYSKIGKPIDEDEWGMNPQTVNAYYSPNRNEIVFPAAILQAPFFDLYADDAVNYGAIGVVIGHEMTHGFDDQGRKYDKDGNLTDWWNKEDAENFENKTKVLVDQFNDYIVLDSLTIDGELTLGENIADNGGLYVSYNALLKAYEKNGYPEDIDGLNWKQRFFISYAQVWRQNIRDKELMRRLKEDVHSPGEARVNGAVVNIPYFYEAFDISESDPLFVKEENRAKIW